MSDFECFHNGRKFNSIFRVTVQKMTACNRMIRQYLAQSPFIIFIIDATTINFNGGRGGGGAAGKLQND